MTSSTDSSLLLPSPERCPACDHAKRNRLGPIRYGANALVADQNASQLAEQIGPIELVKCERCGFRWTDPQYSMDAVIGLYRQNQEAHWEAEGRDWEWHVSQLKPLFSAPRRVLDVGCYTGDFLDRMGQGWDRYGIEPIPYAAEVARKHGIRLHEGTLEDADFAPESFDLITLWDVAEHLFRPFEAFSRLASWLRPGGVLALETGNAGCGFARLMGPDWWYVALLEHCSFYTVESFRRLFERCGLTMESCRYTYHHRMRPTQLGLQLAKAGIYRIVSRAATTGILRASNGVPSRLLKRHAPCALLKDHLFLIARKPG
jgi:SAM-dependent methyltransferase